FIIRQKVPGILAVLIMYLTVFGSLFATVYFFFPPILADAEQFFASVPQYLNTINVPESISGLATPSEQAAAQSQSQSILSTVSVFQQAFVSGGAGAVRLLSTFFGGIFSLFLVIVLSFYFALQETGIDDFLRLITPAKNEDYVID